MTEALSRLRVSEVPTVRAIVEQKIREAIMEGTFKPGQRLIERELCELIGVSRPSIREALRLLEADGLVTIIPNRGPVVSTINLEEAEQIYAARTLLEGYVARECARRKDPEQIRQLQSALADLKRAAAESDRLKILEAKTVFYAALMGGAGNVFIERMLRPLHQRITLLRATSMSQPGRIKKSLREISDIVRAIAAGDETAAEQSSVDHVKAAASAALDMLQKTAHKLDIRTET
jgi:DNA-binding GntR family transcriptional regulator